MSRSYKKHPYTSTKTSKDNKTIANRKFRRDSKELDTKSKKYKRNYSSWDIRDYCEVAPSFQTFCTYIKEHPHYCRKAFLQLSPSLSFEEKARILYNAIYIRK